MDITLEQIAARAYERFVERGSVHGHDVEDWIGAQEDLERGRRRYDVELLAPGGRLIEIVRAIRELTGMGLRDIEEIVNGPPGVLCRAAPIAEAERLKTELEALGARVDLHPH